MTFFVVEMASFLSALLRGLRRLARTASSSGFRRDVGLIWSDGANSVFADERAFLRTPHSWFLHVQNVPIRTGYTGRPSLERT